MASEQVPAPQKSVDSLLQHPISGRFERLSDFLFLLTLGGNQVHCIYMTTKTAKVINGSLTLPREIGQLWERADVLLVPSDDTLLVKRIGKPLKKLSDVAERIATPAMATNAIQEEVDQYRKEA